MKIADTVTTPHRPIAEIEADLKRAGDAFDNCTGCEYTDLGEYGFENTKRLLGDKIFNFYGELGAAMRAAEK